MAQDANEKELIKLLQDITCLDALREWTDRVNIFEVLKISRTEIRHSNMLAWLLDPNENHGLGSTFLQAFITDLTKSHTYEYAEEAYDAIVAEEDALQLLTSDLSESRVYREWNHIDILITLPEHVIAIENKVDASEGHRNGQSQLKRYKDILEKHYDGKTIIKLYLTPRGDKPTQGDWKVYTYGDILTILKNITDHHLGQVSGEVRILINNYADILSNEIMGNDKLKVLCNEIYRKHKTALDLIFQNIDSVTAMASSICFDWLKGQKQENDFVELLDEKKSTVNIKFITPGSKALKDRLDNIDVYYGLEFRENDNEGVKIKMVLILHNLSRTFYKPNADIINAIKESGRVIQGDWEWTSVWSKEENKTLDESEITGYLKKALEQMKDYETKKLSNL